MNADSQEDSLSQRRPQQTNPLAAAQALLSRGSAQKWPERREEPQQEQEDNPYQVPLQPQLLLSFVVGPLSQRSDHYCEFMVEQVRSYR